MKFSVLLSLYAKERPEFLRESLESVFCQTLPANEVILVEDGPLTPDLYKLVHEYSERHPELKIVSLPKNGGLGKALNIGLQYCSNELVIRMDTDDICFPDRFKIQLEFMESHPEVDVCGASVEEFIDNIENIVGVKRLPNSNDKIFLYGKSKCPINHPTVIFKKSKVVECGGYGPFPEDYYLWGKMLVAGCKFHNIDNNVLWYRTSNEVYRRRGGLQYCKAMYRLQCFLKEIGYISSFDFLRNVIVRTLVILLPNLIRKRIYEYSIKKGYKYYHRV